MLVHPQSVFTRPHMMNDSQRLVITNYSRSSFLSVTRTAFPFFRCKPHGTLASASQQLDFYRAQVPSYFRYCVAVQHMSIQWIVIVFVYNWITTFAPVFRCHSHLNLSLHREHKPDYVLDWSRDGNQMSRARSLSVAGLHQRSSLHLQNCLMMWMHCFKIVRSENLATFCNHFNLSLRFETFSKTAIAQ